MTINLKIPDAMSELKPRITVFGVGGAGGNAVNNMIQEGLDGVEFVVANTDAQALAMSSADKRIQMGTNLTEGLGAGSQPKIGAAAAQEAQAEILDYSAGSHMVFITAGMGGGTGTGAAPVIAQLCKEQDILTVAVVTKPFQFEGVRRMEIADEGIEELGKYVDTLIVIPNQNLFRIANEKTTFSDAFAMADQVLLSGVSGITDLMVKEGLINLDFADVKSIMFGMGKAMMGTGEATGEKRAIEAAEAAISNPLLDDVSMKGAQGLLISITGGEDLTLFEVDEVATRIRDEVDNNANIILGATFDSNLEGSVKVSVVATGIQNNIKNIDSTNYTFNKNYTIPKMNLNKDEGIKTDLEMRPVSGTSNETSEVIEDKKYDTNVSIKKIDGSHNFFSSNDRKKPIDEKLGNGKLGSLNIYQKELASNEINEIPRVSEFFSIKDENISMAMNEQLLDSGEKKSKGSFLSKLVNVGFKKKDQTEEMPIVDNNYSNIELTSKDDMEDNLVDKNTEDQSFETNTLESKLDVDTKSDNFDNVDNDLIDDVSRDSKNDFESHTNEVNPIPEEGIQDSLLDIELNQSVDDDVVDNTIDEKSLNSEGELELPSFLKRQAN
ncbi:MAG: cell division protein FtsZ [Hyphomicrobiales bacterium]|nr:MAG: cell division protein FtsZ [Hyphomicrobiales bacterium]